MKRIYFTLVIMFMACVVTYGQIKRNRYSPKRGRSSANLNRHQSTPGFVSINEFTYGLGLSETDPALSNYLAGFTSIVGYNINSQFMFGAGTGALIYNGGFLVPLFGDFRITFDIPNKVKPYLFFDGGWLLDFESEVTFGRVFLNPGIGVKYPFTSVLSANLAAGFFTQQSTIRRDSFIKFNVGITFKPM